MDISTTCAKCMHKQVCFVKRKLNALNQHFYSNTLIFDTEEDFEHTDEDMESTIAAHCRYFKRIKHVLQTTSKHIK